MTLELGRMRTCRLPARSALLMAFSASLRTLVLTILVNKRDSQLDGRVEVSVQGSQLATEGRLGRDSLDRSSPIVRKGIWKVICDCESPRHAHTSLL